MRAHSWQSQPAFPIQHQDTEILDSAGAFKAKILQFIAEAQYRIYITALYLQEDESGMEILSALHQASLKNPELKITILVDFHRAQRGLIGEKSCEGNAAFYYKLAEKFRSNVKVYGVPVKGKELFGVLHLKGFVFDDTVLYSGASINNIYLHYHERYRLDRYLIVNQPQVADVFAEFIDHDLVASEAVIRLDQRPLAKFATLKVAHRQLLKKLRAASLNKVTPISENPEFNVRPLLGLGRRGNQLNLAIKSLFDSTENELVLYTPYFNLPAPLGRSLRKLLKRGKQVTIVVGDKTANDFYIPPDKPFSKIGALPYFYEMILQTFLRKHQKYLENGSLKVFLWKHDCNSFHLKGVSVDKRYHLFTGHNLNPRAWGLDIENGLLIQDEQQSLLPSIIKEREAILVNCKQITGFWDIESIDSYPEQVKKVLNAAKRMRMDVFIKRLI